MCWNTQGLYKCGKCPECLQERRTQWCIRLIAQNRLTPAFSVLLTYNPDNVPMTSDGKMSLCKRDLQNFFKRLRHYDYFSSIKYFASGEYSPEKMRPHYHILLFGIKEEASRQEIIEIIQQAWRRGFIGSRSNYIKDDAQLCYATSYIVNLFDWKKDDLRERPFNLISKGIGMNFMDLLSERKRLTRYGWYFDKSEHRLIFKSPLEYNFETKCFDVSDDFEDNLDTVQIQQTKFDFKTKVTKLGSVHSYPIPRRWREKYYSQDEREILLAIKSLIALKKHTKYDEKYSEYDATHERPMWQELKITKWKQRKKSKKDKLLQNPDFYIL